MINFPTDLDLIDYHTFILQVHHAWPGALPTRPGRASGLRPQHF